MTLASIWAPIRVDWPVESPPSDLAIRNASRLLETLGARAQFPDRASRGDWPTVCLHWDDAKVEIEVFDDAFELCQFNPKDHVSVTILEYDATSKGVADLIKALGFSDQLQPG